jgi:hypothetical protein
VPKLRSSEAKAPHSQVDENTNRHNNNNNNNNNYDYYCTHKSKAVCEHESVRVFWNQGVRTHTEIAVYRTDILTF